VCTYELLALPDAPWPLHISGARNDAVPALLRTVSSSPSYM
jgi:hypothetical protein